MTIDDVKTRAEDKSIFTISPLASNSMDPLNCMDLSGEPWRIRLSKARRNKLEGKPTSQESLCGSVVG